jgi:hypothetical protein
VASDALIEKVRTTSTDAQGLYRITDLRPGVYTLSFSLAGFASARREELELTPGFVATVNPELRVGSVEETVTVSGQSPIVDVQSTVQNRVMSRDVLDTLPTGKTIQATPASRQASSSPRRLKTLEGTRASSRSPWASTATARPT